MDSGCINCFHRPGVQLTGSCSNVCTLRAMARAHVLEAPIACPECIAPTPVTPDHEATSACYFYVSCTFGHRSEVQIPVEGQRSRAGCLMCLCVLGCGAGMPETALDVCGAVGCQGLTSKNPGSLALCAIVSGAPRACRLVNASLMATCVSAAACAKMRTSFFCHCSSWWRALHGVQGAGCGVCAFEQRWYTMYQAL